MGGGPGAKRLPERKFSGTPAALARSVFGIAKLHPEQARAMTAVRKGKDVLAVLPTGLGKSLIYQVPALLADRPTVVVSPLIALIQDQERALAGRGLPVSRLDSTLRPEERATAWKRIAKGGRRIVLTTPETLQTKEATSALRRARPWLLCVDEAHCISEWGHDFRPAYLRLTELAERWGRPQILALTATATPEVRADLAARLRMVDPVEVLAPPARPNLRLEVELVTAGSKDGRLGARLRDAATPAIVYCATTVEVDRVWTALQRAGRPSVRYHGKLGKRARTEAQERFLEHRSRLVMVATSAFGMGIDKPDIRFVLHAQVPGSAEQYLQEAGRAGRDGQPATCTLLFAAEDLEIQRHLQRTGRPTAAQVRKVGEALEHWASEKRAVSLADLALSAHVPRAPTGSVCSDLESFGVLERSAAGDLRVRGTRAARRSAISDVLRRGESRRQRDEQRLGVLEDYAQTSGCRAAFLRRYFGEADPPTCGVCDRCAPPAAGGPSRRGARSRRGRRRRRT